MKKSTKVLVSVLIIALTLSMGLVISVAEDSVLAEGTCGDNLTWQLTSDYALTILGTGETPDYNRLWMSLYPWYEYTPKIKTINIGYGVTTIGSYAFYECEKLEKIVMADTVESVGEYAFYRCTKLQDLTLGAGVKSVGRSAFFDCNNLSILDISDGVICIGESAFNGCKNLENLVIPDSVTIIDAFSFSGCSQLENLSIGDGAVSIGAYAFSGCNKLEDLTLGESITHIAGSAFDNCSSLKSLIIPDSVISIGNSSFYGCNNIKRLVIPDGVISIGNKAFSCCIKLEELSIGAGVDSIGEYAFNNSFLNGKQYSIKSVKFLGDAPKTFGNYVFPFSAAGEFVIQYHNTSSGWTSPKWNGYYTVCVEETIDEFSTLNEQNRNSQGIVFTTNDDSNTAIVGMNTTALNNSSYYGNNNGKVVIPASVTKGERTYKVIGIGQNAFASNKLVKSIRLGANISSVDSTATLNCSDLTDLIVDETSLYYSGNDGVLYDKTKNCLYIYPSGKTNIDFTVPETVKTIGTKAFAGNLYLENLNFALVKVPMHLENSIL